MSVDNVSGESLYTPRRVQKCLFGSGGSSRKKKIYKIQRDSRITGSLSGEESDLGPMSPLALSDQSPKILPDSPKSLSNSPLKNSNKQSPNQTEVDMQEAIPQRQFGKELLNNTIETPHKSGSPENKLITPLTSENKMILLPKLHRRKSLNILDIIENSPERKENMLKRHALEELGNTTTKLLKTDENHSVPKARAALFQDKNYESKLKNITLSTKNFYSNSEIKRNYKIMSELAEQKQQGSSTGHLPYYRKSTKRYKIGGINAGVSHGIKKPKANLDTTKKNNTQHIINIQEDLSKEVKMEETEILNTLQVEESPSPEIDFNKRFFKIKKSSKRNSAAIVTINNNVKLKVESDGKMALNKKNGKQGHKRQKLIDISFDATDLSVDEPELEATIEKDKVANILKTLEDDWADDDYDIMEVLTNERLEHISPLKPVAILNDITMSPASELSNMTSIMNIKDISTPTLPKNIPLDNYEDTTQQKYYPLFIKGYSSNKTFNETSKKSIHNAKENINWQLSIKLNGSDNQYQLDAGQTNFGATQCTECGVVYQIGDPEDENAHLNYHNNRKSLKFPGWKSERVIMEDPFTSSRIILVEPGDSKLCWKKVTEVLTYVDRDLGLVDTKLSNYEQKKVYLYIRDKAIIGVLVAEHITTAHRMIPELLELDCCTAESSPAKCGINVVWTDLNHRKQGIATKLVDVLRAQFYFGYIMSVDGIAFSIPTPSGKIFAEKYTKTRNFKVYS
ncbi:N-acetyltransferase ESCO1 [Eufriesea mexicana]|uniref:N-acetyltransferase ESCO1 n=1 Tax=Eufriesea mexicana TaxID=516756 RepID=A0A310SNX0_9HYME|nr:N-acetyltransferase ESCO1 [Eufriesea mexicana]